MGFIRIQIQRNERFALQNSLLNPIKNNAELGYMLTSHRFIFYFDNFPVVSVNLNTVL
jgi:hypothetical protein